MGKLLVESVTMEIPINADVYCSDGLGGRSSQVIVDPIHKQVTHFVVKMHHSPHTEYLVPLSQIIDSTSDRINLTCTLAELTAMEPFIQIETIENDAESMGFPTHELSAMGGIAVNFMTFPHGRGRYRVPVKTEAVPNGEITLTHGAHIHASDGQVGTLDGLLIDTSGGEITHLVLGEGHLWGQKTVVIPVSQIDHIQDENVYLKLDKESIGNLPATPTQR